MTNRRRELAQLVRIRLLMFVREPEALFWVFLFPIVLALVLGIAFKSRGTEKVRIGIVEEHLGLRWASALRADSVLVPVYFPDRETAERKLRSGAVAALVEGTDTVRLRYDPARPQGELARLRIDGAVQKGAGRLDLVPVVTEVMTEHGARYIDFLVPGLLGMNLMGTGIWGSGFAIVDMRQKKLLKRLVVTPMRRSSFLLSHMTARFVFLVTEVTVITLFGMLALGVPFRGSLIGFAALCVLGAFCFSGLGLLLAARARTIEGVSGLMNFVMMPMWLLSGVFFSYEKFPQVFQPVIRVLPLTALNDGLRGLMLEGLGLSALWLPLVVLLGWTMVCFATALRFFRWS